MSEPSNPQFMIVQLAPENMDAGAVVLNAIHSLMTKGGAQLLVNSSQLGIEALERGSLRRPTLVARWADPKRYAAFRQASETTLKTALASATATVVSTEGLPEKGLPDTELPNIANVVVPESADVDAYMLVQGTSSDQTKMGQYRDIIQPLIRELGGYYDVYSMPNAVEVIHGDWSPQALIISRWPDLHAARRFWYCDRYQNVAIPARTGAGQFSVLLFEAARDEADGKN